MNRQKSKLALLSCLFGAGTFGLFYLFCILDQKGFSYMGVKSNEGSNIITRYFLSTVVLSQLKILFVYLLIGAIFGILVFIFWSIILPKRCFDIKLRYKFLVLFVSLLLLETFFLARNILKYPALYSEFFYERGGVRKSFELFITNNSPPAKIPLNPPISPSDKGETECPNIIIIGADSLRQDHINSDITPNIFSIAKDGMNFTNCFVSLPRTLPQWITFFKSRYPAEHGVRNMFPDKSLREHEIGSFPDILRRNGYTNAVVSDFAGDVFSRLNIGFDIVKTPYFNFNTLIEQRGLEIHYLLLPYITNYWGRKVFPVLKEFANNADPFLLEKEVEDTILKIKKNKFFLTVFFSTAHFPYASCYPYYNYWTPKNYQGAYKYYKPNIPGESVILPEEDLAQIRALYKQSVSCIDDAVGRLRLFLKKQNLDKNTIIVVLADHGEQLYENEWGQGHGEHLRGRSVLNIPFIIYDPREKFKNNRISELVRDIDFAPTLLNLLSLSVPKTMEGVNLLPLMRQETENLNLTTYAETGLWFTNKGDNFYQRQRIMYPDIIELGTIDTEYNNEVIIKPEYRDLTNIAKHRMVYDGRYKLIYIPTRESVFFELYDTKKDPDELENIVDKNPQKAVELKTKLYTWIEKDKNGLWRNDYFIPCP
ncbi:MAG: sulfatase [bacterium]